jgi:SAM-dependent methyltransferase
MIPAVKHERSEDGKYHGGPERLWAPARLAVLERDRVAGLCRDGVACASVLDVGCGAGVFSETFRGYGCRVTGIDPSGEMIAAARAAVSGVEFLTGEAEALPFPGGSFDLVFLATVLHEITDPAAALREARRVASHRVAVLEWPYREEEMGPGIAHRLPPERVEEAARAAGLTGFLRIALTRLELYLYSVPAFPLESAAK